MAAEDQYQGDTADADRPVDYQQETTDVSVRASDLNGSALAWACASLWGIPAVVGEMGRVYVEVEPGDWQQFDQAAMLRSLVAHSCESVMVPSELLAWDKRRAEAAERPAPPPPPPLRHPPSGWLGALINRIWPDKP